MLKWTVSALLVLSAVSSSLQAKDLVVPSQFRTVDEAVAALEEGDRIVLLPGSYTAIVSPPPGVAFSLVGRGGRDSTTLKGSDPVGPCVMATGDGKDVLVRGITFDRTDAPQAFAVIAVSRRLAIEECRFLGGAGARIDSCEGVVRGSEFRDCFDALRVYGSPLLIEENSFIRPTQYGITSRGSEAKIYRNLFRECPNTCILIMGKRRVPVIGGSREDANRFLLNPWHVVANQSRNEINAQFNYWGPALTASMDQLGYPASLDEIHDHWDQDDRAAGMVDYRNWLKSEDEVGSRGSRTIWLLAGAAALAGVASLLVARSRRRARAVS